MHPDILGQTLLLCLLALPLKQLLLKLFVELERILHGSAHVEVDSGFTDDVLELVAVLHYHAVLELRSLPMEVAVLLPDYTPGSRANRACWPQ